MPSLIVSPTSYEVTKRTVITNYSTDVVLTNIQISKNGEDFIDAISFSQSSAIFDMSSWDNGTYNSCILRGYYSDTKILTDEIQLVVNEKENGKIMVSLNNPPIENDTITVTCEDVSIATIDKTSLTFTKEEYNIPQPIVVNGVYNSQDRDYVTNITLSGEGFEDVKVAILVKNIDIYYGEIVSDKTNITINEKASTTLNIKLSRKPTNNQVVYIKSNNSNVTLNKSSLTFTPNNYNTNQSVTVTGGYNDDLENKKSIITLSSDNVDNVEIDTTIKNIDSYGDIVLSTTSLSFDEGSSSTFTVNLSKAPSENQIVTLSCNNSNATLDKTTLTFTPSNYNTKQTATISSPNDENSYVDKNCTITLTSKRVDNKTLNVTIKNITESPYGNIVVNTNSLQMDEGSSATFTVKLDNEPLENQVITLSNRDNITLDKTSLTFTSSNYNIAQTITVTSAHEEANCEDMSSAITLSCEGIENVFIDVLINNIDSPYRTITNNLGYCLTSNSETEILLGERYIATISAPTGVELTSLVVTMGGVDITNDVVNNYTIDIPSVTDDVIITANARLTWYYVPTVQGLGVDLYGQFTITNSKYYVTTENIYIEDSQKIKLTLSPETLSFRSMLMFKKDGTIESLGIFSSTYSFTSYSYSDVEYIRIQIFDTDENTSGEISPDTVMCRADFEY